MTNTVQTVTLGQLEHDPVAIKGREHRYVNLEDLLGSIPHHGLEQSLLVRSMIGREGMFGVIAGNRRFATLKTCKLKGIAIRGVKVTDDYPVPVVVREASDAETHELAVVENTQRLAPTPMEEARDFAEMAKRASSKEIAVHFGVPVKRVEQRRKLAEGLHPDVQQALIDGTIDLAAAQAFTIEPDLARQAKYLRDAIKNKKPWLLSDETIKSEFEEQLVAGDSKLAKLIGADAYTKAGGVVMADPFGKGSYWVSRDVLRKLVEAHWAPKIEGWKKKGWAFVAEAGEYPNSNWGGGYLRRFNFYPGANKATAEEMKGLGVVYWPDGSYEPVFGVIDEKKSPPPKPRRAVSGSTPDKPKASLDEPGPTVSSILYEALTFATQDKVKTSPDLALKLLVAGLRSGRNYYEYNSPIQIKGEQSDPKHNTLFKTALEWADAQDTKTLLATLAELVGPQVNLRYGNSGGAPGNKKLVSDYVDAGEVSKRFDAKAYFGAVTKDLIKLAYKEMTGKDLADGKKGELALLAAGEAKETGWLPPQLRTPSYAGPGKARPVKLKKAA